MFLMSQQEDLGPEQQKQGWEEASDTLPFHATSTYVQDRRKGKGFPILKEPPPLPDLSPSCCLLTQLSLAAVDEGYLRKAPAHP